MKATILLSILLIFVTQATLAQKLKDKLNQVTGKESPEGTESKESGVVSNANQFDEAKKFLAGEARVYMTTNATGDWIAAMDKKSYTEQFYNAIKSDNTGKVIEASGYFPNDDTNPLFFEQNNKSDYVLIFLNNVAYKCKMNITNGEVTEITHIYATRKMALKNNNAALLADLTNYIKANRSWYDDKIKAQADAANKAQEETKKAESIEGLEVTAIKIIFNNNATEIKYNQTISFSIEATIKDGTKRITPGGSKYASAYKFEISGAESRILNGGSIFQNYIYVPNDVITLTATLISNPKITTKASLNMIHDAVVFTGDKFSFGAKHTTSNWNKAPDTRVEIKKVKNTLTNGDMIAYKIYFGSATEPNYAFKVSEKEYVKVHADATSSTTGSYVNANEKGYDAGNIKIIMDPSVPESINFVTSAKGGVKKGSNGSSGMMGSDGKIETVKTKVSW